jgi:hypothetical protein
VRRAARFVVGLIGVFLLWRGLGSMLPREPETLGLALRYLRYILIMVWALYGAPWVFLRTGLAAPATKEPAETRVAALPAG